MIIIKHIVAFNHQIIIRLYIASYMYIQFMYVHYMYILMLQFFNCFFHLIFLSRFELKFPIILKETQGPVSD
jgi:hypothetical protein